MGLFDFIFDETLTFETNADYALRHSGPALTDQVGGAIELAWDRVIESRGSGEFERYTHDPVGFIEDVLGDQLWGADESPTGKPGQREIAQAIAENDDVAWGTCHGVGKTWLLARISLWFFITRPDSIVISTAPLNKQVKDMLWRQIRNAHANSRTPLPGRILTQRAEMPGSPEWYMVGFATDTPAGADSSITAQGYHAVGGLLFVVDEASGVPEGVYNAARGYLTGGDAKRVYIGNQNSRHGRFYDAIHGENSSFVSFQTSAFDAPQSIGRHAVMNQSWIKIMQKDCGPNYEADPLYQVQVLGVPPSSDSHSLIPLSLLEENKDLQPDLPGRTIGVDVARLGDDKCVAFLNDRGRLKARHQWSKARTHESAEIISQLMTKWRVPNARDVKVDVTGVGGGVVDDLYRREVYVEPVDFGAGPQGDWDHVIGGHLKFKTRRSELHYIYYRLMHMNRLAIPERYERAWSDTVSLRSIPDETGFFKIEPKEKMKQRIGRSPDDTDAILCSLSRGSVKAEVEGSGRIIKRRRRRAA